MSSSQKIDSVALHGVAGEFVRLVEPHTEADPAALLFQFLVAFGNLAGRNSYVRADSARHYPNLFAVLVGRSAKGRKGTSWGHVANLFREAQSDWFEQGVVSGLTSGEGLIASVADPLPDDEVQAPPGWYPAQNRHKDKRRLVIESEFGGVLRVLQREGNRLSPVIRDAWDGSTLSVLTKNEPLRATGAHISIVGHITEQELRRYLNDVEVFNGFGNRFLWVTTCRSKLLPFGGDIDPHRFADLCNRMRIAIAFATSDNELRLSDESRALWAEYYQLLSVEQPGLFGTMIARSEPLVLRLALIFALLDSSLLIFPHHLEAAMAVWKYSEETCRKIFGGTEEHSIENTLLEALRREPNGLTQTEIVSQVFRRNRAGSEISVALRSLEQKGRVFCQREAGGVGRPGVRWFCVRTNELTN